MDAGSVVVKIKSDLTGFHEGLDKASSKLDSIASGFKKTGLALTAGVTLPIVAMGIASVKAASDLNETINKVDVAFKEQADTVKSWAKTSVTSMGLAKQSALDAAALFGDMGTAMGLSTRQAADMSMSMVQLGADLASFKNISFEEAQTALAGVFTGETESLKHLGIIMTEANLNEYALQQGIKKTVQEMTQAEKVQLRYAYVMSVTKNAQGDFIRTSEGTANQMRIVGERFKELQAEIGARLLPVANKLLEWAGMAFDWFEKLPGPMKDLIVVMAGIAAAIGPILIGIGFLIPALAALAANPIILIIGAIIAALVVLGFVIHKVVEHFGGWQKVWDYFRPVMEWFKNTWTLIVDLFNTRVLPALQQLWSHFKEKLLPALQEFWEKHGPAITKALEIIATFIGVVLIVSIYALVYAVEALINVFSWLIDAVTWVVDTMNGQYDKAVQDWTNAINFINAGINQLILFFQNLPYNIGLIFGTVIRWFMELPQRAGEMVNNIANWLNQLPGRAWNALAGMYNAIVNWLWAIPGQANAAGNAIVNGFIGIIAQLPGRVWGIMQGVASTIGGFAGWLWEQGRRIAASVWEGFKRGLGIHSPSYIEKAFMAIGQQSEDTLAQMHNDVSQLNNLASTLPTPGTDGMGGNSNVDTKIFGNINIGSEVDADNFLARLAKNQDLANKGLATNG